MDIQTDEDEHSIEMHLPYVRKAFEGYCLTQTKCSHPLISPLCSLDISVVPVLVGAIDAAKEKTFGEILAPYLARDDIFWVVSSDFCHWSVAETCNII